MAYIREEKINNSISAITEDGITVNLTQEQKTKTTYYNVQEMNGRHNSMELFNILSEVAKSGQDNRLIGNILSIADKVNEVHIHNMTELAEELGVSRESLKKLMSRATEYNLLYKINTGHYIVNPYVIMSKGLTAAGYATQEAVQVRWIELTGLITNTQITKLTKLTRYLKLPNALKATEFNISVAEYYANNGTITDKQRSMLNGKA